MVRRRGITIYEVLIAYALFVAAIVALAPSPRPALDGLRASFEREVARGLVQGELARVEHRLRAGEPPQPGPVGEVLGSSKGQLAELALAREVEVEDAGVTVRVRATWRGRDGASRELALTTWLRGAR